MVTNKEVTHKFDYNDAVLMGVNAPKELLDFGVCSVCGIQEVENEYMAKQYGVPLGTILYLVENGSGEAKEVPEKYLVKYE